MKVELTRTGRPALWEEGGGRTKTGSATIIAGPGGRELRPLVRRNHANGQHALFVIAPGFYVLTAERRHRHDISITIERITEVHGDEAKTEEVSRFELGEWSVEPPAELESAIEAAYDKVACYHCRTAHFCELQS